MFMIDIVLSTLPRLFRLCLNILGSLGLALIIYEVIKIFKPEAKSPWFDDKASYLSTLLTLVGTLFTVGSIYYFPARTTPPETTSVIFTAPTVLVMCVIAIVYFFREKGKLPANIVNGFAILALVGSLLRTQPNPSQDPGIYWNNVPAQVESQEKSNK
jgi:drug/metabolite transporter (DMT)-like permease